MFREARGCPRCPELARTRNQVVFGAGNADADLMFVGEAPGAKEDELGIPFVGAAGKLLDELLGEVGLARSDVFIANVLKCLRYNAMVQLGDGTWERIGRLVRTSYGGTVMSVDEDGSLIAEAGRRLAREPARLAVGLPADIPVGEARRAGPRRNPADRRSSSADRSRLRAGGGPACDGQVGDGPGLECAGVRRRVRLCPRGQLAVVEISDPDVLAQRAPGATTRGSRRCCSSSSIPSSTLCARSPSVAASEPIQWC